MCGIIAIFGSRLRASELRSQTLMLSKRIRHRGPDWNGIYVKDDVALAHERLAIVDLEHGAQPLYNEDGTLVLSVNGEIYNHKLIRAELEKDGKHSFATNSDCEVILHAHEEHGIERAVSSLSGDFAFAMYDSKTDTFYAARDPIGVVPLYIGYGKDGSVTAIHHRHQRYYAPHWFTHPEDIPTRSVDLVKLRESFESAVVKRMMSDVPYGVLLSGGLDSSLVAAVATRHAENRIEENEQTRAWWPRIHSFCIGLKNAPDLLAARDVAKFLGTVHHEFHFTVQEGIDALTDVVHHLETYDVTTIRASTPMYFLARKIKATGVKMVLSGEGSDEIFGGYLYFHRAPNHVEFHKETVKRVHNLHLFDCLRANKSTSAWGLEVRVPFLDKDFLDEAMTFDPIEKQCSAEKIEKYILRKAFDTPQRPYLPDSVLWRQKEQFSDGVGYSWIDGLRQHAELSVSDAEFAERETRFPLDTPNTKEAYFYRCIFARMFPEPSCQECVSHWVPTWSSSTDPSGRAQLMHVAATTTTSSSSTTSA